MKTLQLLFGLLLFLLACNSNRADKSQSANKADSLLHGVSSATKEKLQIKISIADTLNKYISSDSLYHFDNLSFYVGKVNGQNIGLVQFTDTSFIIYQKKAGQWQISDTCNYPLSYVQQADLNGDNLSDLIITYFFTAAGGNSQNICLLFNPSTKMFYHNEHFDLSNIYYDKKSNLVFSAWWASANHPQEKMSYKITGDSLTFKQGVTYEPDEKTQGDIGTVEFYTMNGNKRIITKKIKGKSDKTFEIFTKALWDTHDE